MGIYTLLLGNFQKGFWGFGLEGLGLFKVRKELNFLVGFLNLTWKNWEGVWKRGRRLLFKNYSFIYFF